MKVIAWSVRSRDKKNSIKENSSNGQSVATARVAGVKTAQEAAVPTSSSERLSKATYSKGRCFFFFFATCTVSAIALGAFSTAATALLLPTDRCPFFSAFFL